MRKLITGVLAAILLGGCATYAGPVPPPPAGVYVAPPPVVVAPGPVWWHWGGYHGWRGHWR
jgi:hypothetical protein